MRVGSVLTKEFVAKDGLMGSKRPLDVVIEGYAEVSLEFGGDEALGDDLGKGNVLGGEVAGLVRCGGLLSSSTSISLSAPWYNRLME